jgi:hypothetical protein
MKEDRYEMEIKELKHYARKIERRKMSRRH